MNSIEQANYFYDGIRNRNIDVTYRQPLERGKARLRWARYHPVCGIADHVELWYDGKSQMVE